MWDVIVVGTGMGGGMLGYRLARSGRAGAVGGAKGRSTLPGTPGTIRAAMPELVEPLAAPRAVRGASPPFQEAGARPTRSKKSADASRGVRAVHRQRNRPVVGPLRHGL